MGLPSGLAILEPIMAYKNAPTPIPDLTIPPTSPEWSGYHEVAAVSAVGNDRPRPAPTKTG